MRSTAPAPTGSNRPPGLDRKPGWRQPRRILAVGVMVGAATLAVALAGLALDHRLVAGASAWLKPAKFGISVTVYLLTLRWLISYLSGHRRLLLVLSNVVVLALLVELVWIVTQAARGTTSHFNETTALEAAAFYAMGLVISTLLVATIAVGMLMLRRRGLDAGLAAGIRWGLGICVLGMLEASLMIANRTWSSSGGHTVGAPDGGPGMPLTEWSTDHGDLRIAHFVGLHALQALPLLAWLLERATGLDERTRARLVAVAGGGQAGLVSAGLAGAARPAANPTRRGDTNGARHHDHTHHRRCRRGGSVAGASHRADRRLAIR